MLIPEHLNRLNSLYGDAQCFVVKVTRKTNQMGVYFPVSKSMEIEGGNGSKTQLRKGLKTEFGRGFGIDSKDRTVSRRHVSFEPNKKGGVHFEVIGRNPIWVKSSRSDEIKVSRRWEGGEIEDGDMFCVSAKEPLWFTAKTLEPDEGEGKREIGNECELDEGEESRCGLKSVGDLGLDSVDISGIDPVKEFGFLVMGQEFNHYPKQMIRHVKTWNWFLEEPKEDSEDDEVSDKKGKEGLRRKRKSDEGNDDDDEWMGESEEDEEVLTKVRKVQNPKYATRSKDRDKPTKVTGINKHSVKKSTVDSNDEEQEDEDDVMLGGFIVENDDMDEEEEDEEEEEEYSEDDEED